MADAAQPTRDARPLRPVLRTAGALAVPVALALLPFGRIWGGEGVLALIAAAGAVLLVIAGPELLMPAPHAGGSAGAASGSASGAAQSPARILAAMGLRMALFVAAALWLAFSVAETVLVPAILGFFGLYLVGLFVATAESQARFAARPQSKSATDDSSVEPSAAVPTSMLTTVPTAKENPS